MLCKQTFPLSFNKRQRLLNYRRQDRTLDEVDEILAQAKLNHTDLLPTAQSLYFSDSIYTDGYKFLELDKHLEECLNIGDSIFITGEIDDNAVICTNTRTYEVTNTETSNSLLIAENLKCCTDLKDVQERSVSEIKIHGIFFDYLEIIQRKPQLKKVLELLEKSVYRGPELEYQVNQSELLSFDELWEKVQASKEELKAALSTMQVVTINDNIRLLDFEYHFRVLSYMLKLIDSNSWNLDEIDYEETMNALGDFIPLDILNNLFDLYTEESKIIDGLQLYCYKEGEVCKFFAQVLLHSAGKFNLDDFLQAWKESVPEGMKTEESMLYGIALIDRKSMPNVVWAFSENSLPENIQDRFKILFETKEKWSVPEISPYIQRLTSDKLDVNALLAKHARASKIDGIKHYSSKHAK